MVTHPRAFGLGSFVDSLIQAFENCRAGLPDSVDPKTAEPFFGELYQKELPRLAELIGAMAPDLSRERAELLQREIDGLIRKVVIPAYTRMAVRFTLRERNNFYLAKDALHAAERAGWAVAGMALGGFVVWAPFVPLNAKEWVIPFALGGLFLPELRRLWAFRRYHREVNELVASADSEITRIYTAHLLSEHSPLSERMGEIGSTLTPGRMSERPTQPSLSRERERG